MSTLKNTIFYIIVTILSFVNSSLFCQRTYSTSFTKEKITCDGLLNEHVWQSGVQMESFTQFNPNPGAPATKATKVTIAYDDRAVYVAAVMEDESPDLILKELSSRDGESNVDAFAISFDTYADGLNAFYFSVTAAGVQVDKRITAENQSKSWDAVWESSVKITDKGWNVEMIIPFTALRFPKKNIQLWRVQASRELRRLRELSYWNPVQPMIKGEVNQYGLLQGIEGIKSPLRLAFTPYTSAYVNTVSGGKTTNLSHEESFSAGMDVKYGINDAFTLDMTLVPDFGQTISDRQVLNVTPFEVFFQENRPFFTEGLELFNKGNLFYTRRLGGSPFLLNNAYGAARTVGGTLSNVASTNQLLNVTKLSGRTSKGFGLGILNGIENKAYATLNYDGKSEEVLINPLTNYSVISVDRNLPNNSNVGIMNTNVTRSGSARDANATGLFFNLRDKSQTYGIIFSPIWSQLLQASGTIHGYQHKLNAGKISGKWTVELSNTVESPQFEINDLGFLRNPNEISGVLKTAFTNYKPKSDKLIFYRFTNTFYGGSLYRPLYYNEFGSSLESFHLFKSRFAIGGNVYFEPFETYDYFEARRKDFEYYLKYPANIRVGGFISSDYRKKFAYDVSVNQRAFFDDNWSSFTINFTPRFRFNDRFTLSSETDYAIQKNEPGYFNSSGINKIKYNWTGDDPIFGIRDRVTVENVLSLRYLFNQNIGLDGRIRHYWSEVEYLGFGKLQKDGVVEVTESKDITALNSISQNLNLFNIDLQLSWRFAPGSDLFIVWKNNISGSNKDFEDSYISNLSSLFENEQYNSLSVRAVYWLDVARFRDKKIL